MTAFQQGDPKMSCKENLKTDVGRSFFNHFGPSRLSLTALAILGNIGHFGSIKATLHLLLVWSLIIALEILLVTFLGHPEFSYILPYHSPKNVGHGHAVESWVTAVPLACSSQK